MLAKHSLYRISSILIWLIIGSERTEVSSVDFAMKVLLTYEKWLTRSHMCELMGKSSCGERWEELLLIMNFNILTLIYKASNSFHRLSEWFFSCSAAEACGLPAWPVGGKICWNRASDWQGLVPSPALNLVGNIYLHCLNASWSSHIIIYNK